jgi:hypothetical protein
MPQINLDTVIIRISAINGYHVLVNETEVFSCSKNGHLRAMEAVWTVEGVLKILNIKYEVQRGP